MTDDRTTKPMSGPPGGGARAAIPERVGAVVLERQLGEGGMGVVWLGRHELLGRDVAVKFLINAVAGGGESDPGFKMFIEGARAAAAVKHPGLTQMHDAGIVDGVPYLVMELVDGPGLDAVLGAGGPMSVGAAVAVMEGVCAAIGELHAAGFVHRDIKPANVLLDADGGVHVTDFGLACERPSVGSARVAVSGTPAYMAPETFRGEVSARSDVYALAMMLYELLVGEPPFAGDVLTLRSAHERDALNRMRLVERGVPEAVAEVIDRGANKNPMLRPRSALHLLESLLAAIPDKRALEAGRAEVRSRVSGARGEGKPVSVGAPDATGYYQTIAARAEVKRKSDPEVPAEPQPGPPVRVGVRCVACGYELRGLIASGRCPECGAAIGESVRPKPLPCVACQYDLVGLDVGGRCPECGGPVAESVCPERLLFADPKWLRRVSTGMWLMKWGLVVLPLLSVAIGAVILLARGSTGRAIGAGVATAVGVVYITTAGIVIAGVVLATAREPGRHGGGMARWVRVTWLGGIVLLVASSIVEWVEPRFPDGFLALPGLHLLLVGVVLLGRTVERIGERVPDRRLIRSGRSVLWPWIGVLVMWLAVAASRAGWFGSSMPINGLRLLSAVVFWGLLYSAVLAGMARRQLLAAAKIATEPMERGTRPELPSPGGPVWWTIGAAVLVFAVSVVPLFLLAPRIQQSTYILAERLDMLSPPAGTTNWEVIVGGRSFAGYPPLPLLVAGGAMSVVLMYGLPVLLGLLVHVQLTTGVRRRRDGVTRCGWCGYALTGVPEARCPECGVEIGGVPGPAQTHVPWSRPRWWRAMVLAAAAAVAVFACALGLVFVGVVKSLGIPEPGWGWRGVLVILLTHTPPFLSALLVFHFMTRSFASLRGRTHCGRCGSEMKGLTNGGCTDCGAPL